MNNDNVFSFGAKFMKLFFYEFQKMLDPIEK